MKPSAFFPLLLLSGLTWLHCGHIGRLDKSFNQIYDLVNGKSAAEVEDLLGPPDSRQEVLMGDERWVWWNYTYLDGEDYAPAVRGQVVHLEIIFRNPARPGEPPLPYSKWRIVSPYGVSYSGLPGEEEESSTQIVPSRVSTPGPAERRPGHEPHSR